jgi:hypothetical protein
MMTENAGSATLELEVLNYKPRVDRVLESKHKFVLYTPEIVEFEYAGQRFRLVLPIECPACDFLLASTTDDWLFLIGRQREPQEDRSHRGAIVIARRREDDLYVTELWHETHESFMMRSGL